MKTPQPDLVRQQIRQMLLDLLSQYQESGKPMHEDLLKIFIENVEDKILSAIKEALPKKKSIMNEFPTIRDNVTTYTDEDGDTMDDNDISFAIASGIFSGYNQAIAEMEKKLAND